ncbi:MAG: hypothetical protein R2792_09370 [Saprospiraceae bacterium]
MNLNTGNLVRIDSIRYTPSSVEIPIATAPNYRTECSVHWPESLSQQGVCRWSMYREMNGSSDDLYASIHEYNPSTGNWKMMLSYSLTSRLYNHGDVVGGAESKPWPDCREWETWTDEGTASGTWFQIQGQVSQAAYLTATLRSSVAARREQNSVAVRRR